MILCARCTSIILQDIVYSYEHPTMQLQYANPSRNGTGLAIPNAPIYIRQVHYFDALWDYRENRSPKLRPGQEHCEPVFSLWILSFVVLHIFYDYYLHPLNYVVHQRLRYSFRRKYLCFRSNWSKCCFTIYNRRRTPAFLRKPAGCALTPFLRFNVWASDTNSFVVHAKAEKISLFF